MSELHERIRRGVASYNAHAPWLLDQIGETVQRQVAADNARVEALLVEAMQMQDFDKLDHLVVVIHPAAPRTVASMLERQL